MSNTYKTRNNVLVLGFRFFLGGIRFQTFDETFFSSLGRNMTSDCRKKQTYDESFQIKEALYIYIW